MSTETPRTDKESFHVWWNVEDQCWEGFGFEADGFFVKADFTEQLERELNEAQAEILRLSNLLTANG